ncbi:alpha-1,2-fucosyltransferase [Hoeflea sp.]|uniref:alpha-1,2-fucosyltransferase n=1 Tax=Hoeflea sp. TaxID=1940281 RepID=UPI003B01E0B1
MIDKRGFIAGPGQVPGLHHFNIVSSPLNARALPPGKHQRLRYAIWRGLKLPPRIVRQRGHGFDPKITALGGSVYLHGYWQSERYFADFADHIRRELTVRHAPDERNEGLLRQIGEEPSISLHIRRGDYVSNPKANAFHGTCSLDYYRRAAKLVADQTDKKPIFYVFSDEPDWAAANLKLPFDIRIVDHNGPERNYEDMRLMSACKHHVIANSSFSWWGAWLNPSQDKIVVAPQRWFADPAMSNPDILPDEWQTLAD